MKEKETQSQVTKTLEDLYNAVDWEITDDQHEAWTERFGKTSELNEIDKKNFRCNILQEALYGELEDRARGRVFLGPIWPQILNIMGEWGLDTPGGA